MATIATPRRPVLRTSRADRRALLRRPVRRRRAAVWWSSVEFVEPPWHSSLPDVERAAAFVAALTGESRASLRF